MRCIGKGCDSIAAQAENECFYFIANFHAMTSMPKPEDLHERTFNVALDFLIETVFDDAGGDEFAFLSA